MAGKLALKRLTASDLTFFAHQFETAPAGKQKAINLNTDVLTSRIYPLMSLLPRNSRQRFKVDLYLYGPGLTGSHNILRKILRQEKNWRLNGELVHNPEDAPNQYDILAPGDIAVFEFSDGDTPDQLEIVFISQSQPADVSLHNELNQYLGQNSMITIGLLELEGIVNRAQPDQAHPLRDLVFDAEVEDIALGDALATEKLATRTSHRKMSPDELRQARVNADRVGQRGEQFIYEYFLAMQQSGRLHSFEWVSADDAISLYDFWVSFDGVNRVLVDVKSTELAFERSLHISYGELRRMSQGPERYDIYRVYNMAGSGASLRISENVGPFADGVIKAFTALPTGVFSDSVSLSPTILPFSAAVNIALQESDDE